MRAQSVHPRSEVAAHPAQEFERDTASARTRSRRIHVDYQAFIKAGNTWTNWVASMSLLALVGCSTVVNLYYATQLDNVVTFTVADVYAPDKEWLFGSKFTGVLNISLVYKFIESDSVGDVTRLKSAFVVTPPGPIEDSSPCVSLLGQDAGSFYAFCDHVDPAQLPEWAQAFDALILQTMYLATVEQYRQHQSKPFLGIAQGFRNKRTGWYQQESVKRLYCTTKQLAEGSQQYAERVLYTKAHGVLRSVDCASLDEAMNEACRAINNEPPFVLFTDGTSLLRAYDVVRQLNGRDWILSPFSTIKRIGQRTEVESVWPIDDCLYARSDSIGWFGAGYVSYHSQIPKAALLAKVELIGMLFIIWLIKFRCALYRAHHALFQLSRLGLFLFLVAPMLYSAYQEQDIMRTIYSWERHTASDWILFWYILSTISLAGWLLAFAIMRALLGSSRCQLGVSLTTMLPVLIGIVEMMIAEHFYRVYTSENGLLVISFSFDCEPHYTGCAFGRFNYLYLVFLLSFLPMMVEYCKRRWRSEQSLAGSIEPVIKTDTTLQLTSFERVCLDECTVTSLVHDCDNPYVTIQGVRHVTAATISFAALLSFKIAS